MPDDPEPPIADAASLFDTDELRPVLPKGDLPPVDDPGGYELEIDPFESPAPTPPIDLEPLPMTGRKARKPGPGEAVRDPDPPPRPVPPPIPAPTPRPKKPTPVDPPASSGDAGEFEAEISAVDPVWTRWAEWGSDVVRLGVVAGATLVLAWLVSGWSISLSLLVMAAGGAATVLLSYPILVTLERPVRITPEQAVTDFFAAASHHFPNYRRMWLLLSNLGRGSGRFGTFEDFRDHWSSRVEGWRSSGGGGKYTPLKFAVVDFHADKSTGKSTSKADYTVHVLVRGRVQDGPVATFRMAHGLVKGPDRMWYLNQGTLESSKS